MVDLRSAVALHGFTDPRAPRPPTRYQELLAPGVVHVDYNDPDHVFRVTVEQVSRRQFTVPATATTSLLDDVTVQLTRLTADTFLYVQLEGTGAAAEAAADEHRRALESWEASHRPGTKLAATPRWPADRLTAGVGVVVTDDADTDYRFVSGTAGGTDTPWVALRRFLPAPPPKATALYLQLTVAGQPDAKITVPLTSA